MKSDLARKLFAESLRLDPDHNNSKVALKNLRKIEALKDKGNKLEKGLFFIRLIEYF
jgi:hypothetical protein